MKCLLLTLFFISANSNAQSRDEFIPDGVTPNKFISVIKESEIEEKLAVSSEVKECLKKYKYDPESTQQDPKKLVDIEDCFKKALPKNKGQLEQFSANLGLQEYGLIQTNNVKEITKFLSDKLYKAMTGVDRNEEDLKKLLTSQSFKNQKMVDQKDFLDLFKTQLTKNALFEISRFCFEDLRKAPLNSDNNFFKHWETELQPKGSFPAMGNYTDDGKPEYENFSNDPKSKTTIYKKFAENIGFSDIKQIDPVKMSDFFSFCGQQIYQLCSSFENSIKNDPSSKVPGGKACISKERLRNIRKAISDTELLAKNFDENYKAGAFTLQMDGNQRLKQFDRGNDKTSIDNLTNFSSADMLTDDTSEFDKKAKTCSDNPEAPGCETFISIGDSDKTKFSISAEMRLKKQIEIARITELKKEGNEKLLEYLEKNGYLKLKKELEKTPQMSQQALDDAIEATFDAKREALIAEIESKIGSRQIKEDKDTQPNAADKAKKKTNMDINISESKLERMRMSQVVLFHNIISSNLTLSKKNAAGVAETTGMRNTNAIKVEVDGQEEAQVRQEFFTNLRDENKSAKSQNFDEISGSSILDPILEGPKSP